MAIAGDSVRVMVTVGVEPAVAFAVFTEEIDLWWRKGIAYRVAGRRPGQIVLEPKLGGRVFEQYDSDAGTRVHETGTITTWEPPSRLAFEWRGSNFAPGEVTLVDIRFTPTESGGTQVALVHSGFAALRPDHPVRHGESAAVFIGRLGSWWGGLLMSLRERVLDRG